MNGPGHLMILAAAGSGKTHRLVTRYLELLAWGAPPERILALTFTRKAAAEFFDRIVGRVAEAASHPRAAEALASETGRRGEGLCAHYIAEARQLVDLLPRLPLGTLDSFFARLVRCFPYEAGLALPPSILDEGAAADRELAIVTRLLRRPAPDADGRREFASAFRLATHGREVKRVRDLLLDFLRTHRTAWREAGDPAVWDASGLWPEAEALADPEGLGRDLTDLEEGAVRISPESGPQQRVLDFVVAARAWQPGAEIGKPIEYLLKAVMKAGPALPSGGAVMTLDRRKVPVPAGIGALLTRVHQRMAAMEFHRSVRRTRGIAAVLAAFETAYRAEVRATGAMAFDDLPLLLAGLGRDRAIDLEYRLDARYDHWLFDEFQDTSRRQWRVVGGLVDEVLQDATGTRTLFYVGDTKQAIYRWRGGDDRLFHEVRDRYNRTVPLIREEHLHVSYRSSPSVLSLVNAVFGDAEALEPVVGRPVAERWMCGWSNHAAARPVPAGHSAVIRLEPEADVARVVCDLVRSLKVLEQGRTCAVLVRRNATAADLADALRAAGLPASASSAAQPGADNPLAAVVADGLRAAAHPGDRLAWGHLVMSPLGRSRALQNASARDRLVRDVLTAIQSGGIEAAVRLLVGELLPHVAPEDSFSRRRAEQVVEAARRFDLDGRSGIDPFLAHLATWEVPDGSDAGVVQVLTVHKAKGLGFDVTIVAEVGGQQGGGPGLVRKCGESGAVDWVLLAPREELRDPVPGVESALASSKADAAYEQLCVLYVAMTRAKAGSYVLLTAERTSSGDRKLLETILGSASAGSPWELGGALCEVAWECGARDEIPSGTPIQRTEAPTPSIAAIQEGAPDVREPAPRLPSAKARSVSPALILQPDKGRPVAAAVGDAVHARLAKVGWLDDVSLRAATDVAPVTADLLADSAARELVAAALQAPEVRALLRCPGAGSTTVWTERAFDCILDGEWTSGIFDRLVLHRDASGRVEGVEVCDWKTDATVAGAAGEADAVARHCGQLLAYAQAAGSLFGVEPRSVRLRLVLVRHGRVLEVPAAGR